MLLTALVDLYKSCQKLMLVNKQMTVTYMLHIQVILLVELPNSF